MHLYFKWFICEWISRQYVFRSMNNNTAWPQILSLVEIFMSLGLKIVRLFIYFRTEKEKTAAIWNIFTKKSIIQRWTHFFKNAVSSGTEFDSVKQRRIYVCQMIILYRICIRMGQKWRKMAPAMCGAGVSKNRNSLRSRL